MTPPSLAPAELVRNGSPVLHTLLLGACSGGISVLLLQPFDRCKTIIQETPAHTNLYRVARHLVKRDGLRSLWRGTLPTLSRVVPGVGLYFSLVDIFQQQALFVIDKHTGWHNIVTGLSCRSIVGLMFMPFTVVKTRFESQTVKDRSIFGAFRDIVKQKGMRGLYVGLAPTLWRDAPFSALYLYFYRHMLHMCGDDNFALVGSPSPLLRFGCAFSAGALACCATQPFDVIKTRAQLHPTEYKTLINATKSLYRMYGFPAFWRGFVPRLARRSLMAALSWTLFDEGKNRLQMLKYPDGDD